MASRAAPFSEGIKYRINIWGVITLFVSIIGPINGSVGSVGETGFCTSTTGGSCIRELEAVKSFAGKSTVISGIMSGREPLPVVDGISLASGNVAAGRADASLSNLNATGPTAGKYNCGPACETAVSVKTMKMNPFLCIRRELPCPLTTNHLCIGSFGCGLERKRRDDKRISTPPYISSPFLTIT